jgi:hypothetical protein
MLPGDAVQIGKDKLPPRRTDQLVVPLYNLAAFHAHNANRAGTVGPVVGSFKIDGGEGFRVEGFCVSLYNGGGWTMFPQSQPVRKRSNSNERCEKSMLARFRGPDEVSSVTGLPAIATLATREICFGTAS